MSVIVKGMEMPRGCEDCSIADQIGIGIGRCRISKGIWDPDPGQPLRPHWCPLRPLPEKHGRLIDADEFDADYEALYKLNDITNGEWFLFREWLNNQKTIVEAEGDD